MIAPALVIGPIFYREVLVGARRPRTLMIQTGFVLALIIAVLVAWPPAGAAPNVVLTAGRTAFSVLAWVAWAVVVLLAPAFTAGTITAEKERNTLGLLMMAEVNHFEIVAGKLLSRVFFLLVLLLLGTPVIFALLSLGGVSYEEILICGLHLAVFALYGGAVGVFFSTIMRADTRALIGSLVWITSHLLVADVLVRVLDLSPKIQVAVSPFRAYLYVLSPGSVSATTVGLEPGLWLPGALVLVGLALLMTIAATLALPRAALGGKMSPGLILLVVTFAPLLRRLGLTRAALAAATGPEVVSTDPGRGPRGGGNPIYWYEVRRRGSRVWLIILRLVIRFGVIGVAIAAGLGASYYNAPEVHVLGVTFMVTLLQLVTTVIAATSVASERETQTLTILASTPVEAETYVHGKITGLVRKSLFLFALPAIYVLFFSLWGDLRWHSAISIAVAVPVLGIGSIVQGVFLSLIMASSLRASVVALLVAFGEFVLSWCCCLMTFNPFLIANFAVIPQDGPAFYATGTEPIYLFIALVFSAGVHIGCTLVLYSLATQEFDRYVGRIP